MKNFQAYDYKTSYAKILPFFESDSQYQNILLLVVGANGSGKTTYVANLLNSYELDIKYINADMVAKEMFPNIKDEKELAEKSMEQTLKMVKNAIKENLSFVYETVFSHPSELDIIKQAKEREYKVIAVHVKTINPQINIERVEKRVAQGGHDVPKDKILASYERVEENVKSLKETVDVFSEFDNSINLPVVSVEEENN